jgi:type VI protein secretion system component VasK
VTGLLGILAAPVATVAQGIPLAPSLSVRLIALAVVEVVLLTLVVLLYILWMRYKREPLGEWWARRQKEGLSPKTLVEIEDSERERIAAGVPAMESPAVPAGAGTAASG